MTMRAAELAAVSGQYAVALYIGATGKLGAEDCLVIASLGILVGVLIGDRWWNR